MPDKNHGTTLWVCMVNGNQFVKEMRKGRVWIVVIPSTLGNDSIDWLLVEVEKFFIKYQEIIF